MNEEKKIKEIEYKSGADLYLRFTPTLKTIEIIRKFLEFLERDIKGPSKVRSEPEPTSLGPDETPKDSAGPTLSKQRSKRGPYNKGRKKEIYKMFDEGKSIHDVVKKFNVSMGSAYNYYYRWKRNKKKESTIKPAEPKNNPIKDNPAEETEFEHDLSDFE